MTTVPTYLGCAAGVITNIAMVVLIYILNLDNNKKCLLKYDQLKFKSLCN